MLFVPSFVIFVCHLSRKGTPYRYRCQILMELTSNSMELTFDPMELTFDPMEPTFLSMAMTWFSI
jgi:hypothetical protein